MRLRLTRQAARQLANVLAYIDERNPEGARNVQLRLAEVMNLLLAYPFAGADTVRPDRRRIVATPFPYAVTYRIEHEQIIVLGVRHTARRPARSRCRGLDGRFRRLVLAMAACLRASEFRLDPP